MPLSPPARPGAGTCTRSPSPRPRPRSLWACRRRASGSWCQACVPALLPPLKARAWGGGDLRGIRRRCASPGAHRHWARHAPLNPAGPAPAPPPPAGPRPQTESLDRAPAPPRRAPQRISWNSLPASGTNTSPLGAAAPPKTLALGTPCCSHLWDQASAVPPGSAWPESARPELEARNTRATQTLSGLHSTGRDTGSSHNHTT